MVCSQPYTPGAAAPVNVDAPVLTVIISKLSDSLDGTKENLRLTITTGAGSGTQNPIPLLYNGSGLPYVTKPRPINGTVTIDYEVTKGAPSHYWCAT